MKLTLVIRRKAAHGENHRGGRWDDCYEVREKGIISVLAKACEKRKIWGIKIGDMLYGGDAMKIISSLKKICTGIRPSW
jgi:ribosomal protein L36